MVCNESSYDPYDQVLPQIYKQFGRDTIQFAGDLPTGYEGRPLIREWFKLGMSLVDRGFVCFLNGDIILPKDWMRTAYRVFDTMQDKLNTTLVYGTRTDVHQSDQLWTLDQNDPLFLENLAQYLSSKVRCNNPYGMDLVMVDSSFRALNWDELPDFVVGMCVWDNFFQGWANKRADTVSMNFNPRMYHVDHRPNACNDSNYLYFRKMARASRVFGGFQEHYHARWTLKYASAQLTSRRLGTSINLAPEIAL